MGTLMNGLVLSIVCSQHSSNVFSRFERGHLFIAVYLTSRLINRMRCAIVHDIHTVSLQIHSSF